MWKKRYAAILLILALIGLGWFVYQSEFNKNSSLSKFPFKLGLDLKGGSHIVYQADVSKIPAGEVDDSMNSLRDVIERRINSLGVAEPQVYVENATVNGDKIHKLVVEIPGVTDVDKAIALIGKTPILEFKTLDSTKVNASSSLEEYMGAFTATELTGKYLKKASLNFNQQTYEPIVSLEFNDEGTKLFKEITEKNIGNVVAIFLDGQPISMPKVRDAITDGKAEISGGFKTPEAKELVRNLNYGALPVPIGAPIGTQTIGPSLGADALAKSMHAGLIGFIVVAIFLIFWYRLPGVLAVISLTMYTFLMLALFKLIPVVLTSAGLAGFILSIGMAVDANILIFSRMKEEMIKGLSISDAIKEGFHRAWTSIRDGNLSSIITAFILFYFATSALIKGFALVFGLGVIVSMFTAITVSRTFLLAIGVKNNKGLAKFLFGSGVLGAKKF